MRNLKTLLSLLQLLLLCGVAATASAASDTLQQKIEQVLLEEGLTGISWALLDETGELQLGTAGVRDNSSLAEFEPQHRFHVGSVTKSVLATGVLRLVTTGKIELDAPVERYLPAMAFDNPWHNSSPVTVRHLLDHSSGIEDARLWQMFSERPLPKTPLSEAFPDPGALLKVRSRPGTRFSYSNVGYTLLGMLIEAVSGETYESWLDRELLAPLAMLDSSFEYTSQEGEPTTSHPRETRRPLSQILTDSSSSITSTLGLISSLTEFPSFKCWSSRDIARIGVYLFVLLFTFSICS